MSYIMWCDLIKYGCDVLHRVYDIVHIVGVMSCRAMVWWSSNEWVLWHRSSGCHFVYNGYDVVNYRGCDLRNTFGVISSIQWMWWHRYSGHDIKYSGCDEKNTVVWDHKVRIMYSIVMSCILQTMPHIWQVWCHTKSGCDVVYTVAVRTQIVAVMSHV